MSWSVLRTLVLLHEPFHVLVPLHEADVSHVDAEEYGRFVPVDMVVTEEPDKNDQRGRIEGAVAKERPPGKSEDGAGEQGAHPDDEEDVEDRATHDGTDADVVERHEHADHGGEELRRGAPCGHEGGPGHGRHEELVAHDGQGDEHVYHSDNVEYDRPVAPLLHREQILREERVLLDDFGLVGGLRLRGVVMLERMSAEGQQHRGADLRAALPPTLDGANYSGSRGVGAEDDTINANGVIAVRKFSALKCSNCRLTVICASPLQRGSQGSIPARLDTRWSNEQVKIPSKKGSVERVNAIERRAQARSIETAEELISQMEGDRFWSKQILCGCKI
ncbi:hypothetical protein J6590_002855 [Homalodisca vitripennis]|nr:hypothetical protein J6590_002855 [Homalodisca vitripennis]